MRTLGRLSGVLAVVVALTVVSVERLDDRTSVPASRVPDVCVERERAQPIPLLQVVTRLDAPALRERQRVQRAVARQQTKLCASFERSAPSDG